MIGPCVVLVFSKRSGHTKYWRDWSSDVCSSDLEGKLEWDKPVRTFLPGFQMYDANTSESITPRDLVTHRSGLPRHDLVWYNNNSLTRKDVVERLRYLEPNEQLRAKWQYNNLMFLTAGYLTEYLTGKSWEEIGR